MTIAVLSLMIEPISGNFHEINNLMMLRNKLFESPNYNQYSIQLSMEKDLNRMQLKTIEFVFYMVTYSEEHCNSFLLKFKFNNKLIFKTFTLFLYTCYRINELCSLEANIIDI